MFYIYTSHSLAFFFTDKYIIIFPKEWVKYPVKMTFEHACVVSRGYFGLLIIIIPRQQAQLWKLEMRGLTVIDSNKSNSKYYFLEGI